MSMKTIEVEKTTSETWTVGIIESCGEPWIQVCGRGRTVNISPAHKHNRDEFPEEVNAEIKRLKDEHAHEKECERWTAHQQCDEIAVLRDGEKVGFAYVKNHFRDDGFPHAVAKIQALRAEIAARVEPSKPDFELSYRSRREWPCAIEGDDYVKFKTEEAGFALEMSDRGKVRVIELTPEHAREFAEAILTELAGRE